MRIQKTRISASALSMLLLISSFIVLIPTSRVDAVSPSEWRAGNIISDSTFTSQTSTSVTDIQFHINELLPSVCDISGSKNAGYYAPPSADTNNNGIISRAEYGAFRGNPAPFTCLKDYYENPVTKANNYGGKPIPVGAKSAAQLIMDAGAAHNINPQVLLTMLRKESAVLVDDWPFLSQYQYAMGARCPDGPGGANCDPEYAGFGIQMNEGARLLRYYIDNMSQPWWPNKKPGNNTLLWNTIYSYYNNGSGSVQCGGSNVFIENKATAALYTYTPYQPNPAAVAAFPAAVSTGSSFDINCAAYGNRNFWYFFNEMFGPSTYQPANRIAVLRNDGCLWIKENNLGGAWSAMGCDIADYKMEGRRVVVLKDNNELWALDGSLSEEWTTIRTDVKKFEVNGFRIVAILNNDSAHGLDGSLSGAWTSLTDNVAEVTLTETRIGVLKNDGNVLVKTPSLSSPWIWITSGATQVSFEGSRIAIYAPSVHGLIMKEGSISSRWIYVTWLPLSQFELEGNRIAITSNGTTHVKEGSLSAPWRVLGWSDTRDFDMTSKRFIKSVDNGRIYIKENGLSTAWTTLTSLGGKNVDIEGDYIGFLTDSGDFYAKTPRVGSAWVVVSKGVEKFSFELAEY